MAEGTAAKIAPWRLNLLRLGYLIIAGGLGFAIWPALLDPATSWSLMSGVVKAMLASFSLLAVIGLRYPLQLLPILFWELGWKIIWMIRVAWPAWSAGTLDPDTEQTLYECLPILLYLAIIPWDHVWQAYVNRPADPWRSQ
jgi:hypothetical protein